MWTMGAAGTVVADWAGDAGRVVEFGTRFTNPVVVPYDGGALEVAGVVKSVDEETRRATVERRPRPATAPRSSAAASPSSSST